MAALTIQVLGQKVFGTAGTTGNNNVYVSVVRSDGTGIINLTAANFLLQGAGVPAGAAMPKITAVAGISSGIYFLTVVPFSGSWATGRYIFGIIVTSGTDHGLGLGELTV